MLSDTSLSIYSDYIIKTDSLFTDNSRNGLDVNLNLENNSIASYSIFGNKITIKPQSVGHSNVLLTVSDDFTGKVFEQVFNLAVYDPMNRSPYHKDTARLNVQLNDTTFIQLDKIFFDPDGDTLEYQLQIYDVSIVSGVLAGNKLKLIGLKSDTTSIRVIADDNRGGLDSVILNFRVNVPPFHSDTNTQNYLYQLNENHLLNLGAIFSDPDNNVLTYDYLTSDSTALAVTIQNDTLEMDCIKSGELNLNILAYDNFGGTDTLKLSIVVNSKPFRNKAFREFVFPYASGCAHIDLDTLFADADNDYLKYQLATNLAYEIGGDLSLCAQQAGLYKIYLVIDDLRGRIAEDSLLIRFTEIAQPVFQYFQIIFEMKDEFVTIDLDTMFSESPGDTMIYGVFPSQSDSFSYMLVEKVLKIYPLIDDTFHLVLYASNNYSTEDSTFIIFLFKPDPTHFNSFASEAGLKVFPNPTKGTIKIYYETSINEILSLFIADMDGKLVFQKENTMVTPGINFYEISIKENLPSGVYLLQLVNKNGIRIKKIIIE